MRPHSLCELGLSGRSCLIDSLRIASLQKDRTLICPLHGLINRSWSQTRLTGYLA